VRRDVLPETMAHSSFRFFRSLRSICVPMTAIIGFSCLLAFVFVLYQPTPGPGSLQRLGWQSWDVVKSSEDYLQVPTDDGSGSEGVDWWNVTNSDDPKVDSSSLPLDVWAPLLPHDTGRAFYANDDRYFTGWIDMTMVCSF
jgi:hypothetical protein